MVIMLVVVKFDAANGTVTKFGVIQQVSVNGDNAGTKTLLSLFPVCAIIVIILAYDYYDGNLCAPREIGCDRNSEMFGECCFLLFDCFHLVYHVSDTFDWLIFQIVVVDKIK